VPLVVSQAQYPDETIRRQKVSFGGIDRLSFTMSTKAVISSAGSVGAAIDFCRKDDSSYLS
jgi:hypothetical protein